jgi:hypothetical protein
VGDTARAASAVRARLPPERTEDGGVRATEETQLRDVRWPVAKAGKPTPLKSPLRFAQARLPFAPVSAAAGSDVLEVSSPDGRHVVFKLVLVATRFFLR